MVELVLSGRDDADTATDAGDEEVFHELEQNLNLKRQIDSFHKLNEKLKQTEKAVPKVFSAKAIMDAVVGSSNDPKKGRLEKNAKFQMNGLTKTLNELNYNYKIAQNELDQYLKQKVELEETKEETQHLIDAIKADETIMLTRIAENEEELNTDYDAAEKRQAEDLIFKQQTLVKQRIELAQWKVDVAERQVTREKEVRYCKITHLISTNTPS